MKKITMLILLVLLVTSISACTVSNRLPSLGKYVMDKDNPEFAWVLLMEDNQFEFNRNIATSYRPTGSYSIEDDVLTLMASEDEVYIFRIKGKQLIFESFGSIDALVDVGTIFEISSSYK